MVGSNEQPLPRVAIGIGVAVVAIALLWAFPLFHVVPLNDAAAQAGGSAASAAAFDAKAIAEKLWAGELRDAVHRAANLTDVASAIRSDAGGARKKFARSSGLGSAYYFVRGTGRVVAADRNYVRVEIAPGGSPASTPPLTIALRVGPVFGNTVRDGCGLLDVNRFPGLHEFNALSAELNALVEKHVLPSLREKATVGASVTFAGCAEAPESVPAGSEPLLTIVPITAEVR